jgi:hypothetical protein
VDESIEVMKVTRSHGSEHRKTASHKKNMTSSFYDDISLLGQI